MFVRKQKLRNVWKVMRAAAPLLGTTISQTVRCKGMKKKEATLMSRPVSAFTVAAPQEAEGDEGDGR
jgi:hypothetical protein